MEKQYYRFQGYSSKLDSLQTVNVYDETGEQSGNIIEGLFNPNDTIEIQDYRTGKKIVSFRMSYLESI